MLIRRIYVASPEEVKRPDLGVPIFMSVLLLSRGVSVLIGHINLIACGRGVRWLGVSALLGLVFVCRQYIEWVELGSIIIGGDLISTIFYTVTGFHGLHVIVGVGVLSIVVVKYGIRLSGIDLRAKVEGAAWY